MDIERIKGVIEDIERVATDLYAHGTLSDELLADDLRDAARELRDEVHVAIARAA